MEKNYNYPTSTGAKVSTPEQTPVIEATMRQLEKQLTELAEISSALEGRLIPVLREPEPALKEFDKVPVGAMAQSMLAIALRQRLTEAESLSYKLSSILRRLEV